MVHSELFLLLPKYEETLEQPDYINPQSIMSERELLLVIENIDEICNLITNENH